MQGPVKTQKFHKKWRYSNFYPVFVSIPFTTKKIKMKNILKIIAPLFFTVFMAVTTQAQLSVDISVRTAPPPLPVYEQPFCPGDGYIWIPGYWAYSDNDYYWVPGTWVRPPQYGLYWTPGYWGFSSGYYGWHRGYWGHHVGFYGGINYGFGYSGVGYGGGMWSGNVFRYNTAVNRINPTVVHNTYVNKTVINNTTVINNRNSFNGQGGVMAKPTAQEQQALKEQHVQPTHEQVAHETTARSDKNQFASTNHGQPAKLAMSQSGNGHSNTQQTHTVQSNNVEKHNLAPTPQAQE